MTPEGEPQADVERGPEEKLVALAARHAVSQLRERLVATLSPKAIEESARRLGCWRKGGVQLEHDDQRVAFDSFVMHEYRPGGPRGLNALQRFERSAALGAVDQSLAFALAILRLSRFTMLEVGVREDEAIVRVQDLFTGEELRLADPALDEPGVVVCAYAIPLGPFWILDPGALLMAPDVATTLLGELEARFTPPLTGHAGKVAAAALTLLLAS